MEIFQTIWTSLTTENELLSKIILIPEIFFETFINMLLFTSILNISANKKQKVQYIIIYATISNIANIFIPNPYRSFINLLFIYICIKLLFKTNITKTILSTIIPILCAVLGESIILKLYMYLLNVNITSLTSIPICRLISALSVQLFIFLVYAVIKYFKVQISILESMSQKSKTIFSFNLVIAIFAISIQFLITGFYLNKLPIYCNI